MENPEVDFLNIKQIRYFVAVFRDGSLSAAAKEQYVTVQAVSKAIADLERELKSDLFVRESRGVHPTPFGKAFYAKAEPVLRDFDELEAFAHNRRSEGVSSLRLALCTPPFFGHEQARASIATFVSKNMGINASVALETGARGVAAMRAGFLDALIVVGTYEHPDVDCMSIGTVAPGVLMAHAHPLTAHRTVTLADIRPYPVSVSPEFDSFNNSIVSVYRKRGVNIRFCTTNAEHFNAFLLNEQGWRLRWHSRARSNASEHRDAAHRSRRRYRHSHLPGQPQEQQGPGVFGARAVAVERSHVVGHRPG